MPREAARFRLRLADGVEEAYAAIYQQSESDLLVVVYGLRFPGTEDAAIFWNNDRAVRNPGADGVAIGPIVAVVSGERRECFQAIGAYLRSLAD